MDRSCRFPGMCVLVSFSYVADGLSGGMDCCLAPLLSVSSSCCVSMSKSVLPSIPRNLLSVGGRRGRPVSVNCHSCTPKAGFMTAGQAVTLCVLRVGSISLQSGFCRWSSCCWWFCGCSEPFCLVFNLCTLNVWFMTAVGSVNLHSFSIVEIIVSSWLLFSLSIASQKIFRFSEGTFGMRPMFHFTERRIETHVCICFVVYKAYKEMECIISVYIIKMSVGRCLTLPGLSQQWR